MEVFWTILVISWVVISKDSKQSFLESMLDGDGSVIDESARIVLGKKKGDLIIFYEVHLEQGKF